MMELGTMNEHFLACLFNMMGVLDRNDMEGNYLVMDNALMSSLPEVCWGAYHATPMLP
jgi:hypothetical protein